MSTPIAIIDARSPRQAIETLAKRFTVVPFLSGNCTYEAVSGHPDVFISQGDTTVVTPNTPENVLRHIPSFQVGKTSVGSCLQDSTPYNCVVTETYIIHKQGFTDPKIFELNPSKTYISVPQAYTRCNLIEIAPNAFITSDKGILNTLTQYKLECLFVTPEGIQLPPYKYGFIGGCMGKSENTIFINGSLSTHSEGDKIRSFIKKHSLEFVELHGGNLYDGGGILFLR
ncbi:MAG: hypothetical protein IKP99_01905 [Bacteroidales bacterium]|nr:hypothetical protein [Bacteroidales bacterium]